MTQLVGAMCDDGKKVITVTDRMVSTGDMTLAYEHPRMKAVVMSDKAVVLTAGTVHEPDLLRQARQRAKGKDRIIDIAEDLKTVYQEIRESHIVDEILRPKAGIKSFAEWHSKQRSLHDGIVMELNEGISRYRLGLSIILVGMDDSGHLILIDDPGACSSYDSLSYCCVGMGERHSDNVFAWYRYSPSFPLAEALYISFEAKKRAEMAGGVGRSTDILVIDEHGIKAIGQDTLGTLEEIYNDRESRSERAGFDKKITELKIQTVNMES